MLHVTVESNLLAVKYAVQPAAAAVGAFRLCPVSAVFEPPLA